MAKDLFQSTHPVRGATTNTCRRGEPSFQFQSTHPVRGATCAARPAAGGSDISIHAPREGCDPCEGLVVIALHEFQSTHPVRGATKVHHAPRRVVGISIHAPREGCDGLEMRVHARADISIHAPREGCDRGNGLRIPRYGHSDHSLASIVLYNPLASPQIRKSAESRYQQIIHS